MSPAAIARIAEPKIKPQVGPFGKKMSTFPKAAASQKDAPEGGGGAGAHDLGSPGFCGASRLAM